MAYQRESLRIAGLYPTRIAQPLEFGIQSKCDDFPVGNTLHSAILIEPIGCFGTEVNASMP